MVLLQRVAFLPLCILAVLLVLSVGCRSGVPLNSPFEQTVDTRGMTLDKMKSCIKDAGIKRGWAIKDLGKGEAQGTLNVRNHTVVVDIFYTPTSFKIVYRDSINMEYTGTTIHPSYNNWVRNLADEIRIRAVSM